MTQPSGKELSRKCRACLENDENSELLTITIKTDNTDHNKSLQEIFTLCTSLEIVEDDDKPKFICKRCRDSLINCYNFRIQCENSDRLLSNELLGLKTENLTSPEEYEDSHNDIEPSYSEDEQFECKKCHLNFPDSKKFKSHLKKHVEKKLKFATVPVEQRTCSECGKVFEYRQSMLKHKRKHGAPPKSCLFCDEVPETPSLLAKHMENAHVDMKNIICSICGKAFFKESNLRLHLMVHSGIKRHICEICGMCFALSGNLASHRRIHTNERPYTCSHCGRGFIQQASLRCHEASHTNDKTHICNDCGASFSRAGALRNHRKRHQSERPFVCEMCGKAFAFSAEKKRHMTIHSGIKNHECEVCGKRFNRASNLNVHIRIHTGETPHICHICNKGFRLAHCLRTHMNSHTETMS